MREKELKLLEVSTTSEQKISSINSSLESAHDKIGELEKNLQHLTSINKSKNEEIRKFTTANNKLNIEKSALDSQLTVNMFKAGFLIPKRIDKN